MVTITPQALPQPLPGTTSPAPVVTLTNPAAALAVLGGNTAVQVAVTASQPSATGAILLLQVAGQTLEVRSPVSLAPGTQVELKLLPSTNGTKAQLTLPDTGKAASGPPTSPAAGGARTTGDPSVITIKGTLQATVIRSAAPASSPQTGSSPAVSAAPPVSGQAALPQTTTVQPATSPAGTATGTTPATASSSASGAASTAGPVGTATGAAPATAGSPSSGPSTALPVGTTLTVTPVPAGAAATPASQQVLSGTVIRSTPGGAAILNTPAGSISLQLPDAPQPGERIRLEIIEVIPPPPQQSLPSLSGGTRSLGDTLLQVMQVLSKSNPEAARDLASRIPQNGPQLATSLIQMVGGLKTGQIGQMVGDNILRLLERGGRSDLITRMREDAQNARRTGGENNDWRSYQLPFLNGQEIEPVRLYLQHPERDDGEPDPEGTIRRFLIDLDLSNMGQLQIDGLIGEGSLDLILRTTTPMPEDFRSELNLIYITALNAIGRNGQLSFRHDEPLIEVAEIQERKPGFYV